MAASIAQAESAAAAGEPSGAASAPAKGRTKNAAADTPYLAELAKGDAAYLARDFEGAAVAYAAAIKLEPRTALAHYRLGETYRAQSKWDEALEALGNAARFAKTLELKARAVFVMADTFERAERLPRASDEWNVYLTIATQHAEKVAAKLPGVSPKDPIHSDSGKARLKRIAEAIERFEAYAAVKERIEKREAEVDKKTGKPASSGE